MQSGACDAPLHFPLNPHHKHQNHQSKQYCLSPNLQKTPSGLSELSGSVVNKKTASQTPKPPIEAVQCLSKPSKTPSGLSELSGSVVNKKNCITIAKIVHRSNTAVSTSVVARCTRNRLAGWIRQSRNSMAFKRQEKCRYVRSAYTAFGMRCGRCMPKP
jgi:hypothetical protein